MSPEIRLIILINFSIDDCNMAPFLNLRSFLWLLLYIVSYFCYNNKEKVCERSMTNKTKN
jgi:hypothetical protein